MEALPHTNARIKELIDEKEGGNVSKFATRIGQTQQVISRLFRIDSRTKRYPWVSDNVLRSIIETYTDINKDWLEKGIGLKYKGGSPQQPNAIALPSQDENTLEVIRREDGTEFRDLGEGRFLMITPLIEQKAYGGYISGWADPVYIDELPKHAIVVEKLHFGVYRSFEVRGDSMNNGLLGSYPDGAIVTGRQLDRSKYMRSKLHLHDFQDFVIVQEEGIQIKRIVKHDVDNGIITCSSLNPDKNTYPDFELHLKDVRELFNVVTTTVKTKA